MITLRIVPVAPFVIINLVAGASHIRLRDYAIGTAAGMTPGVLALTLFADGLLQALRNPGPKTFAVLTGLVVVILGGGLALRRWLRARDDFSHNSE